MKLIELKILKEDTFYKRILDELKLSGLDNLYIKKTDRVDYLDIIVNVIEFLTSNKNKLKKLTQEQHENIVIIIIDEIFEQIGIQTSDEQIEKILKLLKNSLLVQKLSSILIKKIKNLLLKIKFRC
tara:strand:- start:7145 stop:7522 length:378 start_codon:yes stop_codon:yes gene_type:complete